MNIDPIEHARARLALRQLCRTHLYDPNVSLIDVGFKSTLGRVDKGVVAIRVHVAKKFSKAHLEAVVGGRGTAPVPRTIGGFPTDVLEGTYRTHWWPTGFGSRVKIPANRRFRRFDPLQGGISISRSGRYGAGTLGGVVFDRSSGAPMVLSNWHVLVANWASRPGLPIYQPAGMDGGTLDDRVARYARDAMAVNLDAAVAYVEASRHVSALQHEVGALNGRARPEREMRVVKSGRTTGVTRGEVTGTDGEMTMRYGYLNRRIRGIVTIDPLNSAGELSQGGDSGSLYLDEQTRACVALHFAGSNRPERALAIDINPVVDALSVDFAEH